MRSYKIFVTQSNLEVGNRTLQQILFSPHLDLYHRSDEIEQFDAVIVPFQGKNRVSPENYERLCSIKNLPPVIGIFKSEKHPNSWPSINIDITIPIQTEHSIIMHTIKQSAARFQKKRTLHHLKQEHDRRISELEEMIEMGIDFTGTLSRIELYSRIIEKTVQLVPADYHLLFILSPDHSISYIVGHRGFGEMATAVSPTTHISSNTLDQLYELKAPVFDINPFPKSDLLREEAIRLNEMIKSFMIAPIISKDKLLGYIEIANRKNFSSFIKHDLIRMEILTDFGALAIENAFLYEKTEELAQIDDLTHVQNFESANKFLTRLIEEDEPFSMIFLDLDGFKKVNQKYGHLKGNEALRRVSDVIKLKIRSTDMICRFGGDEFMIIIPGPDRDQSQQISIRIIKTLESENMFPDVHLSGSVGIAFFPEDGQDIDMMIQAADSAMYKAKSLGKGRVVLFNKAFKGE